MSKINLRGRTRQERFDIACKGVIEQGGPAVTPDGVTCAYRADSGRKCWFGHLLTDAEYERLGGWMIVEGKAAADLIKSQFYADCQRAHDILAGADLEMWRENFIRECREIAKQYNLDASVLDTPWPQEAT